MSYRHLPLPDFPTPEDGMYHILALAHDPTERGRYSRVEIAHEVSVILIADAPRAVDHWHQAGRTAADLFTLTTRD